MNINLLKALKEQELYDDILDKKCEDNLCPSDYKKISSVFYKLQAKTPPTKSRQNSDQNNHTKQLNSLRILTFNIAEFVEQRKGLAQLERVIKSEEINGQVDIICLTEILAETWNQFVTERKINNNSPKNISEIDLNGVKYECFLNFSKQTSQRSKGKSKVLGLSNNNTGGCAILVSEKLQQRPHTIMFDLNPCLEQQKQFQLDKESCLCLDQEGRLVTALFKDFCIVSVYAPNHSKKYEYEFTIWQQMIINYIQELKETLGDLNIQPYHQTYQNLIEICGMEEVKGISHSFFMRDQAKQIQLDYTFITQNNNLFSQMTTQLVESFQLDVELAKYHIPFYTVFHKDGNDDDSDEDGEDLQQIIRIANKTKKTDSQVILKSQSEPITSTVKQQEDQSEFEDPFDQLNKQFEAIHLTDSQENNSQNSQNQERGLDNIQLSKHRSFNINQNQQIPKLINKPFKVPQQKVNINLDQQQTTLQPQNN